MNKNNFIITSFVLILLVLSLSGCMDYFNISDGGIVYESHPTKVRYSIRYGYWINCSGTGEYLISYDCDKPEVLIGDVTSELLYNSDYEQKTLANNVVIDYNISGNGNKNYEFGINANVTVESFIVSDLNGANALELEEIAQQYSDLATQYCKAQSNETTVFINPYDLHISKVAHDVLEGTGTNNSFLVAKELFIWLKQNTDYRVHTTRNEIQPASKTIMLGTGDCDDLSFLYISLCRSVGIPARFVRGYSVEENNGISSAVAHAWVEVFVGGNIGDKGWIPVECACPSKDMAVQVNQNFGIENVGHLRLFKDDGSNESIKVSVLGPAVRYDSGMNVEMTAFVGIYEYEVLESKELTIDKNNNRAYK